nr:HigA family addiction module antitoxin [Zooshikella ganghwensis]
MEQHNPMHPGVFIKRVYITPFNIGSNELARKLHVSSGTVSRLLNGQSDVSPEMALKLSKVLGRSPESWLLMQDNYDLWQAKQKIDLTGYEAISFAM